MTIFKKIHILTPLLIPLAFVGCSSDEPSKTARSKGECIRFGAVTDFTRVGEYTTNNLKSFNVYAYFDPVTSDDAIPYIDNVEVTKTDNNVWTYSPLQYWPADRALNFYAYAPSEWVGTGGPLKAVEWDIFSDPWSPAGIDLIYAVSPDMTGYTDSPNAQVVFNFRHALSKMTVKMASSNSDIVVKVSNVSIMGVRSRGNFTFPKGNTSDPVSQTTVGSWSGQNTPMTLVLHTANTEADLITLTTTPTDMGDTGLGMGGSKFMIPQGLSFRSNGTGTDTYIAVMCSVYDAKSGEKLWPNEHTPDFNIVVGSTFDDGLLKFPLSTSGFSEWRPGYHYVYNLLINSNEEMGVIEFGSPSVEAFVDVENTYE